jgi:drug/metabolite transporter (DMT)-like permease
VADAPFAPRALESRPPLPRPALGYALVWSAVVLWSLNAVVAKVILDSAGLSSLRLAEVRATGAALILVVAVALVRPWTLRLSGRRELLFLAVFGILGLAFVQLFYFVGIRRLDIGIALVINYLAPVFVALWARFYVKEPVRRRLWFAIALSLLGLSLVVELWGGSSLDGLGVLACLLTALAYAAYVLMAEHALRRGRDVYSLLAWGFALAAVFWAVVQPWWTFPWDAVDGSVELLGRLDDVTLPVWLLLGYVVVLGTVVPFVLLVSALHHVPATRVTIVAMLEPVLAAGVAWLWLEEELAAIQIVGGLVVLAGVVLAQTARGENGRKLRKNVAVSPELAGGEARESAVFRQP